MGTAGIVDAVNNGQPLQQLQLEMAVAVDRNAGAVTTDAIPQLPSESQLLQFQQPDSPIATPYA